MNVQEFSMRFQRIRAEAARALVGQDEVIDHVLIAIFARGHVLLEGVPGLGKTLLVRTLGQVLGKKGDLAGKTVVVTAGGTQEPLDPVRHLSNPDGDCRRHVNATLAKVRACQCHSTEAISPQQTGACRLKSAP